MMNVTEQQQPIDYYSPFLIIYCLQSLVAAASAMRRVLMHR
jgi:hypothetical protein